MLTVLARARAWTGAGDWATPLEEAKSLAMGTHEAQRVSVAFAAACEIAWIQGRDEETIALATGGLAGRAARQQLVDPRGGRHLAPRRRRRPDAHVDGTPYAAEVAGDWEGAARQWEELGSPFAQALALSRGGTRDGLAAAALLFDDLGAEAAAARARAISRARGWTPPRGRRADTRAHPDGLTRREAEVLDLLREGLADAAIAERLVLSRRTVEHHVAAILGKLGVTSRKDVPSA